MAKKAKRAKRARSYRRHPVGLKQEVVGRMRAGENITALARELEVNRTLLYLWKRKAVGQPDGSAEGPRDRGAQRLQELEAKVAQLEGSLGRKAEEVDFFRAALRGIAALRQKTGGHGERVSTEKSADAPMRKAN